MTDEPKNPTTPEPIKIADPVKEFMNPTLYLKIKRWMTISHELLFSAPENDESVKLTEERNELSLSIRQHFASLLELKTASNFDCLLYRYYLVCLENQNEIYRMSDVVIRYDYNKVKPEVVNGNIVICPPPKPVHLPSRKRHKPH